MKKFATFIKSIYKNYIETLNKVPSLSFAILVLSIFCMNLLANKELFKTKYLILDCGFAISWIPFLIMDALCKAYSPKIAAKISICALFVSLAMSLIFHGLSFTPGFWGEYYTYNNNLEINKALNTTFGGTIFIVICSAIASFISALVNSFLNWFISIHVKHLHGFAEYATRSYISTIFAQFIDNLIFATLVSRVLFGWSVLQIVICSITAALFELFCEIIFSPFGYKISQHWQKNNNIGSKQSKINDF